MYPKCVFFIVLFKLSGSTNEPHKKEATSTPADILSFDLDARGIPVESFEVLWLEETPSKWLFEQENHIGPYNYEYDAYNYDYFALFDTHKEGEKGGGSERTPTDEKRQLKAPNNTASYFDSLLQIWHKATGDDQDLESSENNLQTILEKKLKIVLITRETVILLPENVDEISIIEGAFPKTSSQREGTEEKLGFPVDFMLLIGPILMGLGLFALFLVCRIKQRKVQRKIKIVPKVKP